MFLLVAVVVELVVRAQSWQSTHADAVGKEDLRGSVNPGLTLEQHLPLGGHVVEEPRPGPLEGEGSHQQDGHYKVGEEGGEPDDLSRAVETLGDDAVDAEPGQSQAAEQLPLNGAETELQTAVHLENAMSENEVESLILLSGRVGHHQPPELLNWGVGPPLEDDGAIGLCNIMHGVGLQEDVIGCHIVSSAETVISVPPAICQHYSNLKFYFLNKTKY